MREHSSHPTLFKELRVKMFGFFRSKTPTVPVTVAPAVPFNQKMKVWLDELDKYERESSGIVSAEAYSELREMNSLLWEVSDFLATYSIRAEEEYILESTIRTYIPSTLNIFNQLAPADQVEGGVADKQLIEQFVTMHDNVIAVNSQMHENVRKNLSQQTAFVQERFATNV